MSAYIVAHLDQLQAMMTAGFDVLEAAAPCELAAGLGALQRCRNTLDQLQRRAAAVASRSGVWELDGFRSVGPWVAFHTGLRRSDANRGTRQGRLLADMPHSSDLAGAGLLNEFHITELTRCASRGGAP